MLSSYVRITRNYRSFLKLGSFVWGLFIDVLAHWISARHMLDRFSLSVEIIYSGTIFYARAPSVEHLVGG